LDRTKLSSDPLDPGVISAVVSYLTSHRRPLPGNDYTRYLADSVKDLSVLDIGVVEHTRDRMSSEDWKHKIISDSSSRTVGIDVIPELVDELNSKGYDVRLCDATSDADLRERFDAVHIGDVIEHVNSPVDMMKFAKRHLADGGKIIVRTPNPFCFDYVHSIGVNGTDVSNLEHMFYIAPIHMMEIARRSGLELTGYLTLYPGRFTYRGIRRMAGRILRGFKLRHAFAEIFASPESYSTIYVYELTHADS
jgi:SAM-dependent methyltransferase